MKKLIPLFSLLLFSGISFFAQAQDWNNGGGNSRRNSLSTAYGNEIREIAWAAQTVSTNGMQGFIEDDRYVTVHFISDNNMIVQCRDLNDGDVLWEKNIIDGTGSTYMAGFNEGRVFVQTLGEQDGSFLYALDAEDGDILWRSTFNMFTHQGNSLTFADDGNLFVARQGDGKEIISRVNQTSGEIIWDCEIVHLYGLFELTPNNEKNVGYCLEYSLEEPNHYYIIAIDLSTGERKYSLLAFDAAESGGYSVQTSIMVGNNDVIYIHKQNENISAFEDTGDALNLLWKTDLQGGPIPFSYLCQTKDSSVYVPSDNRIHRLDHRTGEIMASSPILKHTLSTWISVIMAATQNDIIYATSSGDTLYCFDKDLNVLWTDYIPKTAIGGVAIGHDGTVVVSGAFMMKAYRGGDAPGDVPHTFSEELNVYPNPFLKEINIHHAEAVTQISLSNLLGQILYRKTVTSNPKHSVTVDVQPGIYFLTLQMSNGAQITKKMIKR